MAEPIIRAQQVEKYYAQPSENRIQVIAPTDLSIVQGEIVANSLADYLQRHPEIEGRCSRHGERLFYTTDSTEDFDSHARIFYGRELRSSHVLLN